MKFDIQSYSIRDLIQTDGLEKALATVAAVGFDGIEYCDFYGYAPQELAAYTAAAGLESISVHIGADAVQANVSYVEALGVRYVVDPWDDGREIDAYIRALTEADRVCRAYGAEVLHHNHFQEYAGGDRMAAFRAAGIGLEPDVFWIAEAGLDPVQKLTEYGAATKLLHVKEMGEGRKCPNPIVGEGKLDMPAIFRAAAPFTDRAVLEVGIYPCPVVEYLEKSLRNMRRFASV